MELKGRRVLVVGLGQSGLAAIRFLERRGAVLAATDLRSAEELGPVMEELDGLGVELYLGGHPHRAFESAELIVVSPGVPLDQPPIKAARLRGATIIGEMGLAVRYLDAPMVAVTGTNGKSTTAALIADMLVAAGQRVFLGGNIGRPLIEAVDMTPPPETVVIEVSSFQLEAMNRFKPMAAVMLNLTPDHLDRHRDFATYARLKARLWADMDAEDSLILNAAQPLLLELAGETRARVLYFGLETPIGPGAFKAGDEALLITPGSREISVDIRNWSLPGDHNLENLLAALLAARLMGADKPALERALAEFKGLRHRLQYVGAVGGVDYYNDSKATNVVSAAKAVAGFERPVILIAGGLDKGTGFDLLVDAAQGRVKLALLIGQAREVLAKELSRVCPTRLMDTLDEAVAEARRQAVPGDVVLLAPACASFDQFENFAARGEAFIRAVERL